MVVAILSVGLWIDLSKKDDSASSTEVRRASDAEDEAARLASDIFDAAGVKGKVTKPGPLTAECAGKDIEKYYRIIHFWSIWDVPIQDLRQGMENLREKLPGRGWSVEKYGPDESPSRSLELIAGSRNGKFTAVIHLYDKSKRSGPKAPKSIINVALTSTCFQAPEGETV
ncbi:hypothetical protein ACMA1D_08850 [Streptomyces sp. 796.1]|uniref:hypothetical protein n=1 Tax=Streptomyces sp. 796.1 TaxID=3163029 RepID=UPI0039C95E54